MAIGTAAAIGLGVAGIGSALGGISSNKAAGKAADAQTQAAAQQTAMQREMYGNNVNMLSPFVQTGMGAMGNINALLGIAPQATGGQMGGASFGAGSPDYAAYVRANPDLVADFQKVAGKYGNDPAAYGQYHWNRYGQFEPQRGALPTTGGVAGQAGQAQTVSQPSAQQAFDQYRNSTGYQFRLNQGLDAVNGGYAGAGTIKSGAAMKAINDYGQGMASQEFANYLGALGNQQSLGMGAASAVAGVGQNTANSLTAISQNAADARSNAALSKTNPLANSLSLIGGGIFGAR